MKMNSFYASLVTYANNYDVNQSRRSGHVEHPDVFQVDVAGFSQYSRKALQEVRTQLRELETRHDIVVKTSDLCVEYEVCGVVEKEVLDRIVERVRCRQRVGDGGDSDS